MTWKFCINLVRRLVKNKELYFKFWAFSHDGILIIGIDSKVGQQLRKSNLNESIYVTLYILLYRENWKKIVSMSSLRFQPIYVRQKNAELLEKISILEVQLQKSVHQNEQVCWFFIFHIFYISFLSWINVSFRHVGRYMPSS